MRKQGQWNPGRVFSALGRIGYSPVSALLDIADNSVSAGASHIDMHLRLETVESGGRKRLLIAAFVVADNGGGMDEAGIENALTLGSSPQGYGATTLSKFGLGLKSAAASLGAKLVIITRAAGGRALRATLDHDELDAGEYFYDLSDGSAQDIAALDQHAGKGNSGTIVRVEKVHTESMPRASDILDDLKSRAGTVFLAFLQPRLSNASALRLVVQDEAIKARDPLFRTEADAAGDLDESTWDGTSVKWIEHPTQIQLDSTGGITATVAVTQLPHPPSVAAAGGNASEAREKYGIGAGNYGFYIYRNGRLISWADSIGGMISLDQDLYSFRGVLEIDKHADDVLNLDVTKSRLVLSEVARTQLLQIVGEAKKKSTAAWQQRSLVLRQLSGSAPHQQANEEINRAAEADAREEELELNALPEDQRREVRKRREKENSEKKAKPEEQERLEKKSERVQFVASLPNNCLWERARHPSLGDIVRVNQSHRLFVELIDVMPRKEEVIKILDIVFFGLAKAEAKVIYSPENNPSHVEKVLSEYREQAGNALSELVRKIETSRLAEQSK